MLRRLLKRVSSIVRSRRAEQDLDDELRFHVDRQAAEFVRDGMPEDQARQAALRAFGGLEQSKEACRDAGRLRLVHDLRQDLRYAARMLRKHAALTAVIVLTLGVGIGANTALFSVVDGVLLKPLSFPDAGQLVIATEQTQSRPSRAVAYPDFADWKARQTTFTNMSATLIIGGILSGGRDPERVFGRAVTRDFFPTLGAQMQVGRAFTAEEDRLGGDRVMVLSYPLWQRRYGGDPSVAGRAVDYNGDSYTIVGVLPARFDYYGRTNANNDIFVPLEQMRGELFMQTRDNFALTVIGRMKPGITMERARADLSAIAAVIAVEHPETNQGVGVTMRPLLESYVGNVRLALMVLLGASGLVLTIACVNVANLLLARASSRRQEIAVRLAIGARRSRICRQLLTESLALSTIGGAFGLFLAWLAAGWLAQFAPDTVPRIEEVVIDWRVLAFALITTTITGLAFGLAPALQTTDIDLQQVMRSGGRTIGDGARRLREGLVVGQIALCVALLIGTGLLVRSFYRLSAVDPGYRLDNVVTMRLRLPDARYRTREQVLPALDSLLKRIAALPGVERACLTTGVPLGRRSDKGFVVAGQPEPPKDRGPLALTQWVTPDYHQTFGIGLLAGRYFAATDREDSAGVAIVDEEFVKKYLPGLEPRAAIGQRVRLLDDPAQWREIVGVARHIRHSGLDEQPRVEVYVPFAQSEPGWQVDVGRAMDIGVRGTASADAIVSAVRQEFRAFDPDVLLSHVTTLEDALSRSMSSRRFNLVLLLLFGGAALLLCVVGIYGVVSYSVAQRTREIGVRLTLGAQPAEVLRLVMGRGLWLVATGIAAGALAAFWLARVVEGLLYGVQPRDPLTFAGAIVILMTVAAFASYVPAKRAMNVDVVAALRAD